MKPKTDPPTASEYGKMVSWLAKQGVSTADIRKHAGTAANNRSRAEIYATLREWLKTGKV